MKAEFEQRLMDKYSKIFSQKDLSVMQTCMCWGIETGDGWAAIIDALCQSIQWHVDNEERHQKIMRDSHKSFWNVIFVGFIKGWRRRYWWNDLPYRVSNWWRYRESFEKWTIEHNLQVEASQVKEKFGGMRFYTSGTDDFVEGLIHMAEQWAARTCEYCGMPGKLRGGGWLSTLCDKCAEEKQVPDFKEESEEESEEEEKDE